MSVPRTAALLLFALLTACPAPATRHYYTLTFPPGAARFETSYPFTVRVREMGINATYDGDQLVYREDVNEVEYAKERRWTERPQRMVSDLVRKYLRQSGLVQQVVEKMGERPPDFVLEGDVDAIEQLDTGEDSFAHLAASLRLVRFETDQVVWRHAFDERRKVPGKSARAVVRALSEILEQEMVKVVAGMDGYFKGGGQGAPAKAAEPAKVGGEPAKPVEPPPPKPAPPADKSEPKPPEAMLRPDSTSPAAQNQELAADETSMNAGKGALFFPALSNDPAREPALAVFKPTGELVAQGRMGTRVVVDPGIYEVHFGSGAGRQQYTVTVEVQEGRVTAAKPNWSALELRVVNDRFIGFRGSYEIISMPGREEYGIGFGVAEETGEEVKVWVLPPGLYKVVQAGGTYHARTNFATVYLEPGKLTHFTLVKDQDTNDFKGAGVFTEEEQGGATVGPWKRSLVLGGEGRVGYTNSGGTPGWNYDLSLFGDAMVRYLKEPHLFFSRLELEAGMQGLASTRRFSTSLDHLYFHNIYIFHLISWLGPYVHAGLETQVLPHWQDWTEEQNVVTVVEQNDAQWTLSAVDRVQISGPFSPLQLKEGAGGNVRALHTVWVDLDLRAGIGARQYFPSGELALDAKVPTLLRRVAQYHLEGVEAAVVGTGRISRWVVISTELDGLMPFDDANKTVFTWRSQVSLRLVSFASLNYLLNVTRDPNRGPGLPITSWEHFFQLRFSYSVF